MAEFGLGHQLWIKSKAQEEVAVEAVQEELLPDEQIDAEEATKERIDRLWREDTWEKIQQSRNKSAAQKIFDRFNRKLTQLGLEDYNQNRWARSRKEGVDGMTFVEVHPQGSEGWLSTGR